MASTQKIENSPYLTTGEAAKLLQCSQTVVVKACNAGLFEGFRLPDSRHRRLLKSSVIAYMREHDIPIPNNEV